MKLLKCLAPIAALFLAACTPGPEDAVSDFFEAGKKGDLDTILTLAHNADDMQTMLELGGQAAREEAIAGLKELFADGEPRVLGSECATEEELAEMGDTNVVGACKVEVEFEPHDKTKKVETDTVDVIDEGNGWKVMF